MDNLSAVKRRSSSVPGPAASTLGLATTRQSHNLASVISGQYVRAGISSPFRLRMMYPRLQSFTRTKASLWVEVITSVQRGVVGERSADREEMWGMVAGAGAGMRTVFTGGGEARARCGGGGEEVVARARGSSSARVQRLLGRDLETRSARAMEAWRAKSVAVIGRGTA